MLNGCGILILSLLTAVIPATAQLDSSSAVLLRSRQRTTNTDNLNSSRYKVRSPESRRDDDDLEETLGTVIPTPVPNRSIRKGTNSITPSMKKDLSNATPPAEAEDLPPDTPAAADNTLQETPLTNQTQTSDVSNKTVEPNPPNPSVPEQVRELILGGSTEDIEEYRKQIHPQDPRSNMLDIAIAPAYYYNDSSSKYSFRRYHSHAPGLGLGMNLWFTPFFGMQSKFFTSFSASQNNGGVNSVPTELQEFEAGLRFRKHFGFSRKAPTLNWGVDYNDNLNKISKLSTTSLGHKTSGLSFVLEATIPNSTAYANTFALEVRPRMKHSEQNTGIEARSGSKNETNSMSFSLGGQWNLDRRNQLFWRTRYTIERNLFDNQADTTDPISNQKPEGVSVTNSLLIFYFGFRWGS